jgi:phosphoglycolate phosphatase
VKYRLIVFDWDGTLIDSAATIVECIQRSCTEMGLGVPEATRASHVIGLGLHDSLRIAVPDLPAERYSEFVALYRKHFLARETAMELFPGMRELIASLAHDRLLAIATGKSRRGLDRALQASGLERYFAASRCADETNPKPHPAMLLELMQELDVPAERTLMIGDTSHDMQMARDAGVDAAAVTYGAHPERELLACGPRGCFSSVQALREWLETNS